MNLPNRFFRCPTACLFLAAMVLAPAARAVPSFARQTGMECTGCHIGAFGPQLTPAGIRFKLGGYTDTDGKDGKVPLSGMLLADASRTRAAQDPPPDHLHANNNASLDQASLFVAGRASEHAGGFVQITYDGVARTLALDNTDLRWVTSREFGDSEALFGLTLNNNPTVQDPFNTLAAWGYPFVGPAAGFGTGSAAALIDGGLGGIVAGLSAYTLWDKHWYAELGSYRSMSPSLQSSLGLGRDFQKLEGNAYWRLAYLRDQKSSAWHVGMSGWSARVQPDRTAPGPVDSFRDLGLDADFQFLGTREHIVTLSGSLAGELHRTGSDGTLSHLVEQRLNASYSWQQTWGASTGYFATRGSDPAAATRGLVLQADWTPWGKEDARAPSPLLWANLKLGAQFWHYGTFDGAHAGASGHDTFSLFAWSAF